MEKKCCKLELLDAIENFLIDNKIENDRTEIEEWVYNYINYIVRLEVDVADHPYL